MDFNLKDFLKTLNLEENLFGFENEIDKFGMILTHIGIVRKFSKKYPGKQVKAIYIDYDKNSLEKVFEEIKKLFPSLKIFIKIFKGERKVKEPIMIIVIFSPFRDIALKALEYVLEKLKKEILVEKEIFED